MAATTNNSGNYSLIVTNSDGSVTSSIAVLNVGFCACVFCTARQPDKLVRQQRRLQRDGQRLDATCLSMAQKRDQPCQRHRHLRRNQQCPNPHRRHDQQQRQLQFVRDEQLWRDHQQRGRVDRRAAADDRQFHAHRPARSSVAATTSRSLSPRPARRRWAFSGAWMVRP